MTERKGSFRTCINDIQFEISFRITGEGVPVVLLHGYLSSHDVWNALILNCGNGFQFICIDLPGHGTSPPANKTYALTDFSQCLKNLATHLELDLFYLAGHSMGGYAALSFTQQYASCLAGIFLINTHPFADDNKKIIERKKQIQFIKKGKFSLIRNMGVAESMYNPTEDLKLKIRKMSEQTTEEGAIQALQAMMSRKDMSSVIKSPDVPFLWMTGKYDQRINHEKAKTLYPDLICFNHSAHMIPLEEPKKCAGVVKSFIFDNNTSNQFLSL